MGSSDRGYIKTSDWSVFLILVLYIVKLFSKSQSRNCSSPSWLIHHAKVLQSCKQTKPNKLLLFFCAYGHAAITKVGTVKFNRVKCGDSKKRTEDQIQSDQSVGVKAVPNAAASGFNSWCVNWKMIWLCYSFVSLQCTTSLALICHTMPTDVIKAVLCSLRLHLVKSSCWIRDGSPEQQSNSCSAPCLTSASADMQSDTSNTQTAIIFVFLIIDAVGFIFFLYFYGV